MDSIVQCFGNIIGTTQDKDSDSGLYITDLEAVSTIEGLIKGEGLPETEVEEKLDKARRIAIQKLHTDITTMMLQYSVPRQGFSGQIGNGQGIGVISDTDKSGLWIVCKPIRDAEIVLYGINTLFAETGVTTVKIASNTSDAVTEIAVDTQANKLKINKLPVPLAFPLYNADRDGYVQYFIYHENELTAINNKIKCSTCSKFTFDCNNPSFREYGMDGYISVGGFHAATIEEPGQGINAAKGLQLNLEVRCRTDKAICRDKIDFYSNPLAMSYATAIQYKAASSVIWDLIRTPNLNRVLMGDMESFREAATFYDRKYNDMIRYISQNMPIESDCYCVKNKSYRTRA
jgi:hypothetical protein